MKGPEKQTKRPMDAGVLMPVPCMPLSCLSEPMGGEKAPRSLQNLWRLHQFGKPCIGGGMGCATIVEMD